MRHSDDFVRSSLLKKHISSAGGGDPNQDFLVSSEGAMGFADHNINPIDNMLMMDSKPVNSPIGPIAYLSKYQGHHHSIPVSSSIQTANLR